MRLDRVRTILLRANRWSVCPIESGLEEILISDLLNIKGLLNQAALLRALGGYSLGEGLTRRLLEEATHGFGLIHVAQTSGGPVSTSQCI